MSPVIFFEWKLLNLLHFDFTSAGVVKCLLHAVQSIINGRLTASFAKFDVRCFDAVLA